MKISLIYIAMILEELSSGDHNVIYHDNEHYDGDDVEFGRWIYDTAHPPYANGEHNFVQTWQPNFDLIDTGELFRASLAIGELGGILLRKADPIIQDDCTEQRYFEMLKLFDNGFISLANQVPSGALNLESQGWECRNHRRAIG